MSPRLFQPITLRGLTLANRIVVAPMAQFSAPDGVGGDWHLMHLGQFAGSGAALVLTESTYVAPNARNAQSCLSLYSERQEQGIKRVADLFHAIGQAAFGVHLCHAGRKASAREPWAGGGHIPLSEGGYEAVAPSAISLAEGWPPPRALTASEIAEIVAQFGQAAQRAHRAGVDHLEIHGAHGYLIHQFLSPITNRRTDQYGGSFANRTRFAMEVFECVRANWPDAKPVGMRLSATDWIAGGWDVAETVQLSQILAEKGLDYLHISSGGLDGAQRITTGPGYQVPFAAAVKAAVQIPVVAVGQISDPLQAETILGTGQADMIGVARVMIYNPRWPWHAALALGGEVAYPRQYERGHPARWGAGGINAPGNKVVDVTGRPKR